MMLALHCKRYFIGLSDKCPKSLVKVKQSCQRSITSSTKACPELRILFCGSDEFSATSLKALLQAQRTEQLPIKSLDVVCRPPKRVGTGLKKIREVPIVHTATSSGLPIHKIDTFRHWDIPQYQESINLIIAVSFGLLIPSRIINGAQYGGLNVHPSLLPDFRGAAPIQHSLLAGCTATGVSLQTLHPSKFDHGLVLAREPVLLNDVSLAENEAHLAKIGADLLVKSLRSAVFLPPLAPLKPPKTYLDGSPVQERKAPKITPEDRHIDWNIWTSEDILRRHAVLGSLWSYWPAGSLVDAANARIQWSGGFEVSDDLSSEYDSVPGNMFYRQKRLHIPTCDGRLLSTNACKPAGKTARPAHEARQIFFSRTKMIPLS